MDTRIRITNSQMNNRPTPETDAFSGKLEDWINFAEKLERERDEARAELSLKCQSVTIASGTISDLLKKIERLEKQIEKVRRERDEAREQINEEVRDYELELRKLCEAYNDLAERNAKLKAYFIQKSDSAERERDEARNDIIGWENKWKFAVDMAARAELERDDALNKIKELNDILR